MWKSDFHSRKSDFHSKKFDFHNKKSDFSDFSTPFYFIFHFYNVSINNKGDFTLYAEVNLRKIAGDGEHKPILSRQGYTVGAGAQFCLEINNRGHALFFMGYNISFNLLKKKIP